MTWKPPIWNEKKGQVVRVFRPEEVDQLIENSSVEDEGGKNKRRWLMTRDLTNEDIRTWLRFLLYSGCRFTEATIIYSRPDLYQDNGLIRLPYYPRGKAKRSIQARNILLSYKGREIMDKFFEINPLPAANEEDINQTLVSLTLIMHEAGKRIQLQEEEFTKVRQVPILEDGKRKLDKKGKPMHTQSEYQYRTNGCMVRSMRKTWESWLLNGLSSTDLRDKILQSQGHTSITSLTHYFNIGYDNDDLADIKKEVEGYGVIGPYKQ